MFIGGGHSWPVVVVLVGVGCPLCLSNGDAGCSSPSVGGGPLVAHCGGAGGQLLSIVEGGDGRSSSASLIVGVLR